MDDEVRLSEDGMVPGWLRAPNTAEPARSEFSISDRGLGIRGSGGTPGAVRWIPLSSIAAVDELERSPGDPLRAVEVKIETGEILEAGLPGNFVDVLIAELVARAEMP
jgi:hypothetical protein